MKRPSKKNILFYINSVNVFGRCRLQPLNKTKQNSEFYTRSLVFSYIRLKKMYSNTEIFTQKVDLHLFSFMKKKTKSQLFSVNFIVENN